MQVAAPEAGLDEERAGAPWLSSFHWETLTSLPVAQGISLLALPPRGIWKLGEGGGIIVFECHSELGVLLVFSG